jgi:hypothetical protein
MNSRFVLFALIVSMVPFGLIALGARTPAAEPALAQDAPPRSCQFDKTMLREVLENYLSRAISMEGLLNGKGDLEDNLRMLKNVGAKFIGRALCYELVSRKQFRIEFGQHRLELMDRLVGSSFSDHGHFIGAGELRDVKQRDSRVR